jgi:ribosomal protein S25
MKPECALREFVQQTDQVVAPLRVYDLVNQYGIQLLLAQQLIYPLRERNVWAQYSAN